MKKLFSFILAILIILPVFAGCGGNGEDTTDTVTTAAESQTDNDAPVPTGDGVAVGSLRVNYENEPVCVEGQPMFSWVIASNVRGTVQSSYRVKVAESSDKLSSADLVWDSGVVSSDACTLVECGGELREAVRYYWSVTVTDDKGNSAESAPSSFVTALTETGFGDASWITENTEGSNIINFNEADWIWLLKDDSQGSIPEKTEYFRYSFDISKEITYAAAIFTADDFGELYVNGTEAIKITREGGWKNAGSAVVTELLKQGRNLLACRIINGEFGYGAAIVKLLIKYSDGTSSVITSNGNWLGTEKFDPDWYKTDASEAGYEKVNSVTGYGGNPWNQQVSIGNSDKSAPMLRCEFEVGEGVVSAKLFASAAGLYVAYVNGAKADNSVLDPGRTEYDKRIMYQCCDVTDQIKTGVNAIGAMLGRGWYIGAYSPYGATIPAFICKLVIDYADGTRQLVCTDDKWSVTTDGPITYDDIFNGEHYDSGKEKDGWTAAGYDAGEWDKVSVTTAKTLGVGTLCPQLSGTVQVMDTVTAKSVSKIGKTAFIYDFGQNLTGVASVKLKGKAGTKVKLRHAEMLNDGSSGSDGAKGTLYTANLRSAQATDEYILKGDEDGEVYTPVFTYHGFRYMEISGLSEAPDISDVKALVLYSYMEDTGSITTSDTLINALISNTYWGQRGNFLSTPTDCPQRDERMGWSGDAQIFCGTAAYNMNVKTFFDKYITDLNDAQRSDGSYPDVAPQSNRAQYTGSGNNAWGDAGVIIPWIMYVRYGDISYIEKYYSNMKRYARYLSTTSSDHIRSRSAYGDWLSIGESTPVSVTDTAYCIRVMDLLEKMATLLGKSSDAARFADEARQYREAWTKNFLSSSGKLKHDTQTAYLVALAFDIVPEDKRQALADRLNSKIIHNGNRLTTGFIGCPILLPMLCKYGYTETAFALLQQEEYPSWKYPILQGATTIWERWNSYTIENGFGDAGMNSFNHYSYGSVTEWIYSTLVGITCDESAPGFSHFFLEPVSGGGITEVSGQYESIRGLIKSSWKAENDVMKTYECTVPANTSATLYLPAADALLVTESGKPLSEAEGLTVISAENGIVTIELGCGQYSFEIK
ncbi:MAG: family 78 glycoside hydrolase catalytic domain [Clostridia bacterium]|nr:family 78 glycoside hydrolase catalytic domain [Clostridia bacterium]